MTQSEIAKKLFDSHYKTIKEQIEHLSADELKNIGTEVLISILAKHHSLVSVKFAREVHTENLNQVNMEAELL